MIKENLLNKILLGVWTWSQDEKEGWKDFDYINPNRPQSNKIQQGEVKKMR